MGAAPDPAPPLLLVHGLWMGRSAMLWHARRARRAGFRPHSFRYPSMAGSFEASAARLRAALLALDARHVLAHSLGGLLTLAALGRWPDGAPPGRAVFLGSPLAGSAVARRLGASRVGARLLGGAAAVLADGLEAAPGPWRVLQIAGTRRVGLGVLAGGGRRPGDGTVALAETRSPALSACLELPVSHTGLLFSREVSDAALGFLAGP